MPESQSILELRALSPHSSARQVPFTGTYATWFHTALGDESWEFVSLVFREAFHGLADVYVTAPEEDRRQAKSLGEMLRRVQKDCRQRIARPHENRKMICSLILGQLDTPECKEFCKFIRDTEWQDPNSFASSRPLAAISNAPATAAQRGYLRSLGYDGEIPNLKTEVSRLIEQYEQDEEFRRRFGVTGTERAAAA